MVKVLLTCCLTAFYLFVSAQVAINNTGALPDPSAMLDIQSTSKGFYPPRMTWSQIKNISNPGPGMVVFDLDFGKLRIYAGGKWTAINTDVQYDQPAGSFKAKSIVSELNMEGLKDVAIDPISKNVYVTGSVTDNLYGQTVNGISDAVLIAYSETGERLWTRLFGSSADDVGVAVTVAPDGSIYVGGYVNGSIDGQPYSGAFDATLIKFNGNGDKLWSRAIGTNLIDRVVEIATDPSGNVYIVGFTEAAFPGFSNTAGVDLFLSKFNDAGAQQWMRQSASNSNVNPEDMCINSTGIYITGSTAGSFDGQGYYGGTSDLFVMKYDFSGTSILTKINGTSGAEYGMGVIADAQGNFMVTGQTNGSLNGQAYSGQYPDSYIIKFNSNATHAWTKLYGNGLGLGAHEIGLDSQGNIYVYGTKYNMTERPEFGGAAVFLQKLDATGNQLWMQLGGSDWSEQPLSLSNIVDDAFYLLGAFQGNYGIFGSQRFNNTLGYGTTESYLWKYAE